MKCSKCGFEIESDSAKFCPSCGVQMNSTINTGGIALEGVETASPWRRWSARLFDLWMGLFAGGFLLGVFGLSAAIPNNVVLAFLVFTPFALCLEALEYWAFGGTFGKWVFSVKVLDSNGSKLGGAEYGKRLLPVWISGLGLGIPFVIMVMEIIQYNRLKKGKSASYDEKAGRAVVQYKQGFVKGLVCVLFILAWLALNAMGKAME